MSSTPDPLSERRHVWSRYVATGDSFTEGRCDDDPTFPHDGEFAGWADRLAAHLSGPGAAQVHDFGYANLAVRGRKLADVVGPQLDAALALGRVVVVHPRSVSPAEHPSGAWSAGAHPVCVVVVVRTASTTHGPRRQRTGTGELVVRAGKPSARPKCRSVVIARLGTNDTAHTFATARRTATCGVHGRP